MISGILFGVVLLIPHVVFWFLYKWSNEEWARQCRKCLDLADFYRDRANELEARLSKETVK